MKIKIACTSGITLPLEELKIFPSTLKKHSFLEISRLCESIIKDGFLFPIAVGKVKGVNYIIEGECRYYALLELLNRGYEITNVPIFYIKTNENTIKKNILIGTSTNHAVTETSLKGFAGNEINLKDFAFPTSELIDFHTVDDLGLYVEISGGKPTKIKHNEKDYEGLL